MLARAVVQRLEGLEVVASDAGALGKQGREGLRPGAEGVGLPQQRRVTVQGDVPISVEIRGAGVAG